MGGRPQGRLKHLRAIIKINLEKLKLHLIEICSFLFYILLGLEIILFFKVTYKILCFIVACVACVCLSYTLFSLVTLCNISLLPGSLSSIGFLLFSCHIFFITLFPASLRSPFSVNKRSAFSETWPVFVIYFQNDILFWLPRIADTFSSIRWSLGFLLRTVLFIISFLSH